MKGKLFSILFTILLLTLVFSGCVDDKKEDNENNQTNGETEYNGDISVFTYKTEYISGELVNITTIFENKMDVSFPFGDYSFELNFINKSEYYSGDGYTKKDIPWNMVDTITVSAGETYTGDILWDTTDIEPGNYLIEFGVWEVDSVHFWSQGIDTVMTEIKII